MFLLRGVLLSLSLRNVATLTEVSHATAGLYLPPVLAAWVEEHKDVLSEGVPKKTTLQKHVFALGASYTMLMQSFIVATLHSVVTRFCFHVMAESSSMHGQDWILLELVLVNINNGVFDAMQRLKRQLDQAE